MTPDDAPDDAPETGTPLNGRAGGIVLAGILVLSLLVIAVILIFGGTGALNWK